MLALFKIVYNVSSNSILDIAENAVVESIVLNKHYDDILCDYNVSDLTPAKNSLKIDIAHNLGIDGHDATIGIFEAGVVNLDTCENYNVNPENVVIIAGNPQPSDHPTTIAGIAAGDDGVAPNARIISATSEGNWIVSDRYDEVGWEYSYMEEMIRRGANVINISMGTAVTTDYYCLLAKYLDCVISSTGVSVVCCTGNIHNDLISHFASSFNCIAVNGYDCFSIGENIYENRLNNYSYLSTNCCHKPDIIAPSLNGGTSNSVPFVCGLIALLYTYKSARKNSSCIFKFITAR